MASISSHGIVTSGYRELPVLDLAGVLCAKSTSIVWEGSSPLGSTIGVQTNLSTDGGVTWIGWKTATSGQAIADITNFVTDLSNAKLKVKINLANSDPAVYPYITSISVSVDATYAISGSWTSKVFDLRDEVPGATAITNTKTVPANSTVTFKYRHSDDNANWSAWETVVNPTSLPETDLYHQVKLELAKTADVTPVISSLGLSATNCMYRAYWESDVIDCSQALDKLSGKAVADLELDTGATSVVQSKSSVDGITWTEWVTALGDGSLQHTSGNYVKIRIMFTGNTSKLRTMTVFFDGTPIATLIDEGLVVGGQWSFATLNDVMYMTNGSDPLKKWTGGALEDVEDNPPLFSMLGVHQNRLWGVEVGTSRLRWSSILDGTTWGVLDFIDFNNKDGDKISAVMRFGDNLLVSKHRSKALLTGDRTTNYSVVWLEGDTGVEGMNAVCEADKMLVYVSNKGIMFSDLATDVLAIENRMIKSWSNINKKRLNQASIVHWRHYILVALSTGNSMYNNTVWCYDLNSRAWTVFDSWNISGWIKFRQYNDDILIGADSLTGQLYYIFDSTSDNGEAIEYDYKSKALNFGYPERNKLYKNYYIECECTDVPTQLHVTFIVDGEEHVVPALDIPGNAGAPHLIRLLPPLYGVVLGKQIEYRLVGRAGIKSVKLDFEIRSSIPPTGV